MTATIPLPLKSTSYEQISCRSVNRPQELIHTVTATVYFTTHKQSLGQGNVFTPVCHFVHRGDLCPSMHHSSHDRGVFVQGSLCPEEGSLSRGEISVQVDLCPGSFCLEVSVQGVSVWGGGLCLWGSLSVGVFVWGVSVREIPPFGNVVMSGWYVSYWNAFLFII